ncbi:MAG: nucleotidyl transferase AbiEii/AbiGii toxin family protein, partial [Pseudomonadales bacterium]
LVEIVTNVVTTSVPGDGLIFDPRSVEAERITEGADYEGIRLRFNGLLGKARVRMQIDVGFGDVVHPAAVKSYFPTMLDHPAPILRGYSPETVIAEKVEAMIHLAGLNSRMKDFYDVWRLSRQQDFDGHTLCEACRKTLENRRTGAVPYDQLMKELLETKDKQAQWTAFLKKSEVAGPASFPEVLGQLDAFLSPVLSSIIESRNFA